MSNLLVESSWENVFEMQRIIATYCINVWQDGEESMAMIISPDLLPLITNAVQPNETVVCGNITLGQGIPDYSDVVMLSFNTGGDWFLEIPLSDAEELRRDRAKKHLTVEDLPEWSW